MMETKKLMIPSRKYKGETTVVSVRLPVDMIKELDHIAKCTGRTRNEIVMTSLEFAIDNVVYDSSKNKT